MGSHLAPSLANLFLGYHGNKCVEQTNDKIIFYKRYVDDFFCRMKRGRC